MRARDISHTRPADVKPGGGRFSLKILLWQNLLLQIDYSPHTDFTSSRRVLCPRWLALQAV